jgi:hypothetical protein
MTATLQMFSDCNQNANVGFFENSYRGASRCLRKCAARDAQALSRKRKLIAAAANLILTFIKLFPRRNVAPMGLRENEQARLIRILLR